MTVFHDLTVQQLVDNQHGLVTQGQIARFGYNRGRVRNLLDSGHWRRVLCGVYAVTNGPLTRDAVIAAGMLYGGSHAILSHRTAAEEWGILRIDADAPVHVTVPYGKSAVSQGPTLMSQARRGADPVPHPGSVLHPGVTVHRSRAHAHIGVGFTTPRTTKADTVIDLAVAESSARDAYLSLVTTVTNARIRLADVVKRLDERPPLRFHRALESAVRLLADGVQSVLEYHYAVDVEQVHGLPSGARQSPVVVDGRTLWEDVDYTPHGVPLIVRLDGRWAHSMREIQFRDRRRDNAAELADRPRLVYGMEEVGRNACEVAREVETVLRREGWVRTADSLCRACARVW
ncbi:type IV toxin-antitoxin system AbiEi family antitoxin domain-containing protein [Rhodococcus triatomae]|nr:hypothetical protein G419_18594 [Rhodococcus triatomae BKS 15-14]